MLPDYQIVAFDNFGKFHPIIVEHYPAGEPYIKETPVTCKALIVRPKSLDTLMAALFLLDTSWAHHWGSVDLILPYFPGARQDKLYARHQGDQLFTARSIAKIINNTEGIKSIKILDPHSSVVQSHLATHAGLREIKILPAPFVLGKYWESGMQMMFDKNYAGIITPDKGATERAKQVAEYLEIDRILHCEKKRDPLTGKLIGFEVEDPVWYGNDPYLVVDDICDGGGTFVGIADEYRRLGYISNLDLFVSHGIFSQGTSALKEKYGTIYCSDSVLDNRFNGVTVIPTVERML